MTDADKKKTREEALAELERTIADMDAAEADLRAARSAETYALNRRNETRRHYRDALACLTGLFPKVID